jgi:signal transduction histidine kinase
LLSNAIKYTPTGGDVAISFTTNAPPGFLTVHISDTGVGMEREQLDNLFKLDQATTTEGTTGETGTGLGLILCKEFIEINGGEIWVESKPNVGSVFSFCLPLNTV